MRLASRVGAFELAGDEIRLAIVQTGGALPSLLEYHATSISYATAEERGEAFVAAVKQMLGLVKAKPALFVLCMDSQHMVVRTLTVPFRGQARVAAAVPVELEPNLAFPIDDLIIDHTVVREAPRETIVLAVAVKQAILEDRISEFAAAGVNIEGVNLDVAGLSTLWLAGQKKPAGLHAQLHVRDDSSVLAVVHNKRLVFYRHIPFPGRSVPEHARALSRDVRNTLRAFGTTWQGEEAIATLTVTGVELDDEARETFAAGLSVPVLYSDLGQYVRGSEKALAKFCGAGDEGGAEHMALNRWEAAVGVAAASAGGGIFFELRKGPLAPTNPFAGLRTRLLGTAAMLLVTLASTAGYCAAQYKNNTAEIDRIGDEIWKIYAETFPDAPEAKERPEADTGGIASMALLEASQKQAEEAGSRLSAAALSRPPLLDIIKELSEKFAGGNVVLTEIRIRDARGGSQALTVSGEIQDAPGFDAALVKLKESDVLKVEDDPVLSTKEGRTSFSLQATI